MDAYTTGWFGASAERPWRRKLVPLAQFPLKMLEIGVFESQASRWLHENVLTHEHSHGYHCDPWLATRKIPQATMDEKYEFVQRNLKPFVDAGRCTIYRDKSEDRLPRFPDEFFDGIYVDGDHDLPGVKIDGDIGWTKLRPGGIMCFDDYRALRAKDGVTNYVNETFFGVKAGVVGLPILASSLYYETSKHICVQKPFTPGQPNVSPIAQYVRANLHDRPVDGPYARVPIGSHPLGRYRSESPA